MSGAGLVGEVSVLVARLDVETDGVDAWLREDVGEGNCGCIDGEAAVGVARRIEGDVHRPVGDGPRDVAAALGTVEGVDGVNGWPGAQIGGHLGEVESERSVLTGGRQDPAVAVGGRLLE